MEAHRNGNKEEHYWIKIIVPQYSGIKRNKKEHYCIKKKMFRNIKEQGQNIIGLRLLLHNVQEYKGTRKNVVR